MACYVSRVHTANSQARPRTRQHARMYDMHALYTHHDYEYVQPSQRTRKHEHETVQRCMPMHDNSQSQAQHQARLTATAARSVTFCAKHANVKSGPFAHVFLWAVVVELAAALPAAQTPAAV